MSTLNGLSPDLGVLAEMRFRIMPARHGGWAYYHKAKYMPAKYLARMSGRLKARPAQI